MFLARHGVADWFAAHIDCVTRANFSAPPIDINFKVDGREDRIEYFLISGRKDRENCCARIGVLPGKNFQQSVALRRTRFNVYDGLTASSAFMNRTRPFKRHRYG